MSNADTRNLSLPRWLGGATVQWSTAFAAMFFLTTSCRTIVVTILPIHGLAYLGSAQAVSVLFVAVSTLGVCTSMLCCPCTQYSEPPACGCSPWRGSAAISHAGFEFGMRASSRWRHVCARGRCGLWKTSTEMPIFQGSLIRINVGKARACFLLHS